MLTQSEGEKPICNSLFFCQQKLHQVKATTLIKTQIIDILIVLVTEKEDASLNKKLLFYL